jgi:hypothetical protein
MFWQQIEGMWCPRMESNKKGHKSFVIQNHSPNNTNGDSYDTFFIMDTCAHLANLTGVTDCKTQKESEAILEQMYVDTKI